MTSQARSALSTALVTTLVGSALLWGASVVWAQKADRLELTTHLSQDQLRAQLDSVWRASVDLKLGELICAVKPRRKGC